MKKGQTEIVNAEFQIIETKLVPASEETKGVQLFTPENKEKVIQAFVNVASLSFSVTPAQCKKLVKESAKLTIKDREDKEGFKKVYDKHREFVKVRTGTEKERKVLTDPFNQIKSGIDKVAKDDILGMTAKEEERLKGLVDQWKEWEQEEADRIEREAKEILDARIKELESVGLRFDGNFYSIGESISVDVVTIKDFTDEAFQEFKKRVSAENEKIQEAKRIEGLHNERREKALPFLAYWNEEEKSMNFGEVSESDFNNFLERIKKAKEDFEETQRKQAEEAKKQVEERKLLNYEKRSFKLEKEGFSIDENGDVSFITEAGAVRFTKSSLETLTVADFDAEFEKKIEAKNALNKQAEDLSKKRKDEAEKQAKEESNEKLRQAEEDKFNGRVDALIKLGLKFDGDKTYIFHDINFDIFVDIKLMSDTDWNDALIKATKRKAEIEKEIADKEEAERLQKLPEIEKAERYIEEVMKVKIPQVNGSEIAEVIADFKNKIKIASDEAISNLKNL